MTNKERYRALCEKEPSIPLYSKAFWMDAVCGEDNWDVLLYEKNGNVLGTLPYYVKEKFRLQYITQPPLTQHNGVWVKYPEQQKPERRLALENEVIDNFIAQLEALPVTHYQQHHSPNLTNWLPFYWKGYKQTTRYTYRIAHQADYSAVFSAFNKVVRKNIEKAEPLATVYEGEDVAAFYEMNTKTFARQGLKPPYSLEFLRHFDRILAENNARKMYFAKDAGGTIHCASYTVFDDAYVYQLMSGTDPQYRKSEFKTLLIDRAIKFACETGRSFDFEGSMIESIEEYFRKFGAIQTPYFSIHKTYTKNPLVRYLIEKKLG